MVDIDAKALRAMLDVGEPIILLDVLSDIAYGEGHIPNAINIPFAELEERVEEVVRNKDHVIIVYSASSKDSTSSDAVKLLKFLGYTHVKELVGGIEGWIDAGYKLERAD